MGEFIEAVGIFIAFVLAVVFALVLVIGLTALTTIACVVVLPLQYFLAMEARIDAEVDDISELETGWLGGITGVARHDDQARTFPHYFFGPVGTDFWGIINDAAGRFGRAIDTGWSVGSDELDDGGYIGTTVGVGIWIGMVLGTAGGGALTILIGAVHFLVSVLAIVIATVAGVVLRGADAMLRYAAGVRMTCPVCAQTVRPYATYKCSGCDERHRDIRPGRRGVVGRVCICGARLPTLLLVGASRMTALCPKCGARLPPRFGKTPDIVIPVFGSVKAGKTQLIYMLVLALQALVTERGGSVSFFGDTQGELDRIGETIAVTGSPSPTVAKPPEALVLQIRLGSHERYLYLFDAAGELHYRDVGLDELRYLDKAGTLVFVADPLAADGVWARLSPDQQGDLAAIRSERAEAELSYELPREQIRRMGAKGRAIRLAFVVTKADALASSGIRAEHDTVRHLVEDAKGLDMGNIVRDAVGSFGSVEFFETTAVADESGSPDATIERLAAWLMRSEGIRFEGS
jgi:hypothetical protein